MTELESAILQLAIPPNLGASVSRCERFGLATYRRFLHTRVPFAERRNAFTSALFPMLPIPNRVGFKILAGYGLSFRVAPKAKLPFAIRGIRWEYRQVVLAEAPG